MLIATLVAATRAVFGYQTGTKLKWDDAWLIAAYLLFIVLAGFQVGKYELLFRVMDVFHEKAPSYAEVAEDGSKVQTLMFFTSTGLWVAIWCVKFSLLALYKNMVAQQPLYTRLWWAVLVYCTLVSLTVQPGLLPSRDILRLKHEKSLVVSVIVQIAACLPVSDLWKPGGCATPGILRRIYISVWQSYSADVTTDLMVMLLPLGIIRGLKMPTSRKLSLGLLFCLGALVIIVSTVRAAQVGSDPSVPPPTLWVAQWNIIETAVAVMVGCGPGLYRRVKAVTKSRTRLDLEAGRYVRKNDGSHSGRTIRSRLQRNGGNEIPLQVYPVTAVSVSENQPADGSSKEGLVSKDSEGKITVTRSITISRAR
ncbi:hypothetical protein PG995_014257 [Apiospora arundinis]